MFKFKICPNMKHFEFMPKLVTLTSRSIYLDLIDLATSKGLHLYVQTQCTVVIFLRSINKNEQGNLPEYHVK